jgi:hypothetical protein
MSVRADHMEDQYGAARRPQRSLARAIKYLAERLNPANPEGEYARAFDIIIKEWGVDGALGVGGTDERTGEDVKISPAKLEHLARSRFSNLDLA